MIQVQAGAGAGTRPEEGLRLRPTTTRSVQAVIRSPDAACRRPEAGARRDGRRLFWQIKSDWMDVSGRGNKEQQSHACSCSDPCATVPMSLIARMFFSRGLLESVQISSVVSSKYSSISTSLVAVSLTNLLGCLVLLAAPWNVAWRYKV